MTCPNCQYENQGAPLFCRSCFQLLDPFPDDPKYINENFDRLREASLQVLEQRISPEDYLEFLREFEGNIEKGFREMEEGDITPDIEEEVGYQRDLTQEGLDLYLKAVEVLASCRETNDKQTLIEGLSLAERGNHLLNDAVGVIEQQEGESGVVMDDRL